MPTRLHRKLAAAYLLSSVFAAGMAWADKPEWAGNGKPGKSQEWRQPDARERGRNEVRVRQDDRRAERADVRINMYFNDNQRSVVRDYYADRYRAGKCPPGLAKKGNGCMPPGQAKKWTVGRPLPRDVVYYDLPSSVVVSLGVPPSGHKYVRVAADILLIAVGTGMVIDAIADLGNM